MSWSSNSSGAVNEALTAHTDDTTDAHDASAISVVPFSTIAATNVQTALEEVFAEAGPTVISPSDLSGLICWLKADAITGKTDGQAISQWDDSSGNTRHATQATGSSQPLYKTNIINSKPVVRFDGTDDFLATAAIDLSSTAVFTAFVVLAPKRAATGNDHWLNGRNGAYDGSTTGWTLRAATGNKFGAFLFGDVGYSIFDSTDVYRLTENYLISAVYDKSLPSNETNLAIDGFPAAGARSSNSNNTNNFGNQAIYVGARDAAFGYMQGDIAEIILYNRYVTGPERRKVEKYLGTKYDLAVG